MSITRTNYDRQYEHIGNIRHGVQTGPWRVEFDAPLKADNDGNYRKVVQGSVVSLDSTGAFILGAAAGTAPNCPVPFISLKNSFDPDVMTGWQGKKQTDTTYSAVGGKITAIPVTCGYELETTEFDSTSTYAPNDALTAGTSTKLGKVVKATQAPGAGEAYLGYVSVPASADYFNNTRLAFFASFIPAFGGSK